MEVSIKSSLEKYNSQQRQQQQQQQQQNGNTDNNNENNRINESDIITDYQPKIVNRGFSVDDIQKTASQNNNINNSSNGGSLKKNEFKSFSLDKNEAKNILSTHIEQREKEIKRQTKLAEKDKKDSLVYVNYIKEYREQLDAYIKDFYEDDDCCDIISSPTNTNISNNNNNNNNNNNTTSTTVEKGSLIDIQQRKQHVMERSLALSVIEGTIQSPFSPITFLNQSPLSTISSNSSTVDIISKSPPLSSLSFWDSPIHQSTASNTNVNNNNNNNIPPTTTISPIMEHEQQSTQHPPIPNIPISVQQTSPIIYNNINNNNNNNNNNNISNTPTTKDEKESVSLLVNSFHCKDIELERVVNRANVENARSKLLKSKFEELSQLVHSEKSYWSSLIEKKKRQVDYKEREINRLLMVAENQKKKLMDCTDQITRLKKSLNSISQIRENSSIVDIKKINDRFSFESLSNSPGPTGSSSSSSSSTHSHSNHHHHHHNNHASGSNSHHFHYSKSISPNKLISSPKSVGSGSSSSSGGIGENKFYTEEKRELIHLSTLSEKKDDEIRRIKDIIEYDTFKTIFFSNKVNELKLILEEEGRQVDSLQNQSMLEIKEKDDAIFKVALRAQKERLKSNQLKDEIKRISRVLSSHDINGKNKTNVVNSGGNGKAIKSPELEPVFMEMGDLKQFQDLSLDQYCDENILSNYILGPKMTPPLQNQNGHTRCTSQQLLYPTFTNPQQQPLIPPTTILSQSPQKYIPQHHHHHLNPCLSPRIGYYIPQSPQQQQSPQISRSNSISSSNINIPPSIKRSYSHDNMSTNNGNNNNNNMSTSANTFSPLNNNGGSSNNLNSLQSSSYGNSSGNNIGSMSSMMMLMNGSNGGISGNHQFLIGSPSEMIMHKLKEIERLNKEAIQKDQELNQVKKIAEAERSRLCLLKDKFKELRNELIEKDSSIQQRCTKTY